MVHHLFSRAASYIIAATLVCAAYSQESAALIVQVQGAAGLPVTGAQVMIGDDIDVPFVANVRSVSSVGVVDFPECAGGNQNVTAFAPGFTIHTQLQHDCTQYLVVTLSPLAGDSTVMVSGSTQGFPPTRRDDKVDVGITMPLLRYNDLLELRLSTVLSPEADVISVFGQRLPASSNITFPDQTERFGLIPITLNKPTFRWPTELRGDIGFVSLHGQVPFRKTIDDRRAGAPITELFNDLQFQSVGFSQANIRSSGGTMNATVAGLQLQGDVRVQGPVLQPGWIVTSIPLHERAGLYFPSDIKSLRSGETKNLRLNSPNLAAGSMMISVLSLEPPTIAPRGPGFMGGWTLDGPDELTSTTIQALNATNLSIPMTPVVSNFSALQAPGTAAHDWRKGELTWTNPASPAGFNQNEFTASLLSVERRSTELGTQSRETRL